MLFLGEFSVSFSGKGRLVIPKKIRSILGEKSSFTLTKGYDQCLAGYRDGDWKKGAQELLEAGTIKSSNIDLKRHIFSSAIELSIDDQGRVVIPQNLLEYASLSSSQEAVFIGVGDHFEIWQKKLWERYSRLNEERINSSRE